MNTARSTDEFITARAALREYRVSHQVLTRLAVVGEVAVELRPGYAPRYNRLQVARFAAERAAKNGDRTRTAAAAR